MLVRDTGIEFKSSAGQHEEVIRALRLRSRLGPPLITRSIHAVAHHHRDVASGYARSQGQTGPPGPIVDPMSLRRGAGAPDGGTAQSPLYASASRSLCAMPDTFRNILAAVVSPDHSGPRLA